MTSRCYRALEENKGGVLFLSTRFCQLPCGQKLRQVHAPKPQMLRRKRTPVCLVSILSTSLFLEILQVPDMKNQSLEGRRSDGNLIHVTEDGHEWVVPLVWKMSLRWRNLGCCRGQVTRLRVQVCGPGASHWVWGRGGQEVTWSWGASSGE